MINFIWIVRFLKVILLLLIYILFDYRIRYLQRTCHYFGNDWRIRIFRFTKLISCIVSYVWFYFHIFLSSWCRWVFMIILYSYSMSVYKNTTAILYVYITILIIDLKMSYNSWRAFFIIQRYYLPIKMIKREKWSSFMTWIPIVILLASSWNFQSWKLLKEESSYRRECQREEYLIEKKDSNVLVCDIK